MIIVAFHIRRRTGITNLPLEVGCDYKGPVSLTVWGERDQIVETSLSQVVAAVSFAVVLPQFRQTPTEIPGWRISM